ncbi:MAG TPA: hypothetical protein PLG99_08125 [Kaistiaceae bacterium]|nr:hypothetical protein [Kaistiaceae bacterium]
MPATFRARQARHIHPVKLVVIAFAATTIGCAAPGLADETDHKRDRLAHTLGKVVRIAEHCPNLEIDDPVLDAALAEVQMDGPQLLESHSTAFRTGSETMERVFAAQEEAIVCNAANDLFGPRGWLHRGILKAR